MSKYNAKQIGMTLLGIAVIGLVVYLLWPKKSDELQQYLNTETNDPLTNSIQLIMNTLLYNANTSSNNIAMANQNLDNANSDIKDCLKESLPSDKEYPNIDNSYNKKMLQNAVNVLLKPNSVCYSICENTLAGSLAKNGKVISNRGQVVSTIKQAINDDSIINDNLLLNYLKFLNQNNYTIVDVDPKETIPTTIGFYMYNFDIYKIDENGVSLHMAGPTFIKNL